MGLCDEDKDLDGWFDPAIKLFAQFTLFLAIVHGVVYGGLMVAARGGFTVTTNSSVGATATVVPSAVHPATPRVPPPLAKPKEKTGE